jgi:hypothetical protein
VNLSLQTSVVRLARSEVCSGEKGDFSNAV